MSKNTASSIVQVTAHYKGGYMEKKEKMTADRFKDAVDQFVHWAFSDYFEDTPKVEFEIDEEWETFEATLTAKVSFGGSEYKIPIGIGIDGEVAIAACADCDSYLDLDSEGLFAYLFLTADPMIRDRDELIVKKDNYIKVLQSQVAELEAKLTR